MEIENLDVWTSRPRSPKDGYRMVMATPNVAIAGIIQTPPVTEPLKALQIGSTKTSTWSVRECARRGLMGAGESSNSMDLAPWGRGQRLRDGVVGVGTSSPHSITALVSFACVQHHLILPIPLPATAHCPHRKPPILTARGRGDGVGTMRMRGAGARGGDVFFRPLRRDHELRLGHVLRGEAGVRCLGHDMHGSGAPGWVCRCHRTQEVCRNWPLTSCFLYICFTCESGCKPGKAGWESDGSDEDQDEEEDVEV